MAKLLQDEEYTFTWKIKNYSCCYQTKGMWIESPIFTLKNLSGTQWSLRFYPKVDSLKTDQKFVSCYLEWKNSDGINKPIIDFSIEILDETGCALKCLESKNSSAFSQVKPTLGWVKFLSINKLEEEIECWKEDVLTLRCRIKSVKLKNQTVFGSEACTVFDTVDRRIFEWDIKTSTLSGFRESAAMSLSDLYNFEVTFLSCLEDFDIYFCLADKSKILEWPVVFKISLYDKKEGLIAFKRAKHLLRPEENWKFPNFLTKEVLKFCIVDSSKYEFKLKCEMYLPREKMSSFIEKFYIRSSMYSYEDVDPLPKVATNTAMQTDFRSLFINKKYCDITIFAGEKEFKAHKLVLRARSPVFETMFDQNMSENETGVVNVIDMDEQTMERFLEYIYTENIEDIDYESAKKLLFSADKYQVSSLADFCVTFLKSKLSVENACELLTIVDSVNCECLKSHVLEYIILNAVEILNAPDWKLWIRNNVELATEILSKFSTDLIRKCR